MMSFGCPICGSYDTHSHDLGVILNSRYYCADGEEHIWGTAGRWIFRREVCTRCGERKPK